MSQSYSTKAYNAVQLFFSTQLTAQGADFIACMVKEGQVILALSNPGPEIQPGLALKSGANRFTDKMKIAAATAICGQTKADVLVLSTSVECVDFHD